MSQPKLSSTPDYRAALDRAAYALFQIKRMVNTPVHVIDFVREEHAKACEVLNAEPSETGERKLTKPAQVGNTRFGVGVSERLVVERAQREFDYQTDPKIDAERLQRVRAFVGSLQDSQIGICPECGTHRFESPCPRGELHCAMKGVPYRGE